MNKFEKILENNGVSKSKFAEKLQISPTNVNRILKKYDKNLSEIDNSFQKVGINISKDTYLAIPATEDDIKTIPFYDGLAVGGVGGFTEALTKADIKANYVVPKFKDKKIDFMIEVAGSSMYPKYNSGDVVACTIIEESQFIQWNKVHVIATRYQGILIKRIKKAENESCILAVSDNKSYDPFEIPLDEIFGFALVVGVIRLE
jgi:phage repressor protein C with HTH and peptisase S24 domain